MSVLMMLLSLAGPPASGRADDAVPHRFYNRPGATVAERAAEIARCRVIGEGSSGSTEVTARASRDSPEQFSRDLAGPGMTLESCMVTRGWRIYALSPRERGALLRLSTKARARMIRTLCGAQRPAYGQLVHDGSRFQLHDPGAP